MPKHEHQHPVPHPEPVPCKDPIPSREDEEPGTQPPIDPDPPENP